MIDRTVALLGRDFHSVEVSLIVSPPRTYGMTFTVMPLQRKVWAIQGNGIPVTPEPVSYADDFELTDYIQGFIA